MWIKEIEQEDMRHPNNEKNETFKCLVFKLTCVSGVSFMIICVYFSTIQNLWPVYKY